MIRRFVAKIIKTHSLVEGMVFEVFFHKNQALFSNVSNINSTTCLIRSQDPHIFHIPSSAELPGHWTFMF